MEWVNVIGTNVVSSNYYDIATEIVDWAEKKQRRYICITNVHSVTMAKWNKELRYALDNSDINTADGVPLVWMQKLVGASNPTRVYGPTLMLVVLARANKYNLKVALYGGTKDSLNDLQTKINNHYPNVEIVEAISPPFRELTRAEDDYFTERLANSGADIILVGIGCPKQEIWMSNHSNKIPGVMLGVGAAFDFHTGRVNQAPAYLQRIGLEWAYRLFKEPKRLAKRYFTTNPVFMLYSFHHLFLKEINPFYRTVRISKRRRQKKAKTATICIATYKRQKLLKDLLDSIELCYKPKDIDVDIVVVDNDENKSAKEVCDRYENITYLVEPDQNIAKARNLAVDDKNSDVYIFVDDDEKVGRTWLFDLIDTYHRYNADAVFGPVLFEHGKYLKYGSFIDKLVKPTGSIIDWRDTRTSNTLVKGSIFNNSSLRFDPLLGRSGGSDSDLFARMSVFSKMKFVTCDSAIVTEYIPSERRTFKWLWNRSYRNGLIFERNMVQSLRKNRPFIRAAKRILVGLFYISKGLLYQRHKYIVQGLLKISLMIGGIHATIRPSSTTNHVAYKK